MKILLVRLRLIGDVVFTTPAIGALRRRFPHAHLTYLVEAPAAPVVRHHPALNDLIIAERPRGLARWSYEGRTGYGISEYLHQLDDAGRPVFPIE